MQRASITLRSSSCLAPSRMSSAASRQRAACSSWSSERNMQAVRPQCVPHEERSSSSAEQKAP
eukprot:6178222-Pleurochrysis_carterae.AAC.1